MDRHGILSINSSFENSLEEEDEEEEEQDEGQQIKEKLA